MTKAYADTLRKKRSIFKAVTKTAKQIFFVLIAAQGLLANAHSRSIFANILTLDDLFKEV